jgi:aminoglycoside phosphotransferase (APT) family kinase protein
MFSDISEITPEWLTSVVNPSTPDTHVVSYEPTNIGEDIGFAGRIYRLKLDYDREDTGPGSVIVKLATGDEKLKRLLAERGMLFKEARFYQELAGEMKISVPKTHHAAYDEDSGDVTIVLEDLGDLQWPDAMAEMPLDQCRTAIETIARMHAQWWNHPRIEADWLTPFTNRGSRAQDAEILDKSFEIVAKLSVECDYLVECMKIVRRHMPKLPGELPRENPVTLIHGDFHPNNITIRDGSTVLFDWQIVERGSPLTDVVNMMMSGLEPRTLLARERELLEGYHQVLIAEGVRGYGFRRLLSDYRRAILLTSIKYFAFLETIDFDVPGGHEMLTTLIERTNRVAQDHEIMRMAKMLPAIIWLLRIRAHLLRRISIGWPPSQ